MCIWYGKFVSIESYFHHVVTITHNCVIAAATVNPATSVRASHFLCLGAAVGMAGIDVLVDRLLICLCICMCI